MKNLDTVLITGGGGTIGSMVPFGIRLTHKELDVTNPPAIEKALNAYKPSKVLHLAVIVDMALCERNPKLAYLVNVLGSFYIADACRKHGIPLTFLSSCAVFDGSKAKPYYEGDIPHPISVYGKTKYAAEYVVQDIAPQSLIVRTGWVFGNNNSPKGFVKRCLELFKAGKPVTATADRFGSPTYINDFFDVLKSYMETDKTGLYHVINTGIASYYDIALEIKRLGRFDSPVIRASYKDVESREVKRGTMEGLISHTIHLASWQQGLKTFISSLA